MSSLTISGLVPFVSNFTKNPIFLISVMTRFKSLCNVGSPPVITTASSTPTRVFKYERIASSSIEVSGVDTTKEEL